nr:hypothetical protein [uncultured Duganella sp.]
MATQPKFDESDATQVLTRLNGVETDLAVIKSNYATKEDLLKLELRIAQMETRLIKWFIGTALTLITVSATLGFFVAKLLH